jgi:NADH:ubiquinone oxidoreductase subunit F (NADH-binding)/NADH:ubiquinone oxidoreductase subunit E
MELLRKLMRLQSVRGYLAKEALQELAEQERIPLRRLEELVSFYPHFRRTPPRPHQVLLCQDVACVLAAGRAYLQKVQERLGQNPEVEPRCVSCLGRCDGAPCCLLNDVPARLTHPPSPDALPEMELIETRAYPEPPETCLRLNPYPDYRSYYATFLELRSRWDDGLAESLLGELDRSGLRGMGGAGFPAGRKWRTVRNASGGPKYVICNADESEPGTFKDRLLLGQYPHLVVEAMALAALTVGASRGIIFIRHEYGPEAMAVELALEAARAAGVVGRDALGAERPFEVDVFVSPGGYILGEETALLEALEDRRGEPRLRPPYPATCGLYGKPTLIHNVETLVAALAIAARGADWWLQHGQHGAHGLKLVSVSGHVRRPGVYEIELGTPVAEILERAGGVHPGPLKGFSPGGASAPWLPAACVDVPYDFDTLRQAGSMLGSGGLLVAGSEADMRELALTITHFFRNESCGKCVPCRVGTQKALEILQEALARGGVTNDERAFLEELRTTLEQTSICGLGQVALHGLCSMLKHWPEEFHNPGNNAPWEIPARQGKL